MFDPQAYVVSRSRPDGNGCWKWLPTKRYKGTAYAKFAGKMESAHRFSYKAFFGDIPDGLHVCHSCDVPDCVNPDHLFLGTAKDNMLDKVQKGRANMKPGDNRSSLCEEDVRTIRNLRKSGLPYYRIAERYGVTPMTVKNIVLGRTWAWVRDEEGGEPSL